MFENMNKGLRLAGVRMFRPSQGMNILDVGCGTGTHLELYQRYQCKLYGIDTSPAMLEIARARLGDSAQLDQGDAATMPYEDHQFDLIVSMLSLHEMPAPTRSGVVTEMQRVLKKDGRGRKTTPHFVRTDAGVGHGRVRLITGRRRVRLPEFSGIIITLIRLYVVQKSSAC